MQVLFRDCHGGYVEKLESEKAFRGAGSRVECHLLQGNCVQSGHRRFLKHPTQDK